MVAVTDDRLAEASWLRAANDRDLMTAMWTECRDAVQQALGLRQLTRDDAIELIADVLSGRIRPPGHEQEIARLVLDNSFATRESAAGLVVTFPSIADLGSLEVEFCTRASTAATAFGALARFDSHAPASLVLAQAAMVRAASLLGSAIDLESERAVQPAVALLCRAIHELWLYVRYLDAESELAVEALVAAHKWSAKFAGGDTEADVILSALTGRDFSHVKPRRPNLRAMVLAISRSGENDASLAAQLAHQSFGEVSNAAVHTSLIGLLSHLQNVDGHYYFGPADGSHAAELLVAALAVSDMVDCQARQANNAGIDEMNRDLKDLSIEVFRTRLPGELEA